MIDIVAALDDALLVLESLNGMVYRIEHVAERLTTCLQQGGRIYFMGNGGSAADAQHLAAELVCRFTRERRALPAMALTTDTSILTAVANDYAFDQVFARQVRALARTGDAVVGISTSGNSPNILAAMQAAREAGAYTVALTGGSGGAMADQADDCLCVASSITARIQEAHIFIGHIICDWIEAAVAEEEAGVP